MYTVLNSLKELMLDIDVIKGLTFIGFHGNVTFMLDLSLLGQGGVFVVSGPSSLSSIHISCACVCKSASAEASLV